MVATVCIQVFAEELAKLSDKIKKEIESVIEYEVHYGVQTYIGDVEY